MPLPHKLTLTITFWLINFSISLSQSNDPVEVADLKALFENLGNESYEIRQKAQNQIINQGKKDRDGILDKSFKFYNQTKDPEIKYRLRSTMLEIIGSTLKPEGFIGIRMVDAPMRIVNDGEVENIRAVRILSVVPNTAASKAGLKPGDQIIRLDGKKFPDQGLAYVELSKYIRAKSSGEEVKLNITRGFGVNMQEMEIDIKLGERPEGLGADRKIEAFNEWFQDSLKKDSEDTSKDSDQP